MNHFATLPGRVLWMTATDYGIMVYYENPKKWWQFWRPKIGSRHLCPHGHSDWDDCPVCCH